MKNPDIRVYIQDMKDASEKISRLMTNVTFEQFEADEKLHLAIERLFEIIGEAANRIPKDIQAAYPLIPWASIVGLRNIIIHSYHKINSKRLFEVIQSDLDILIKELDKNN